MSAAPRRHALDTSEAMGTTARLTVVVDGDAATGREHELVELARYRLGELEARWSRFLVDSEVSALNRDAGRSMEVSDDTVLLVARAVSAWRATAGAFDPTVLADLLAAGYDRTFAELDERRDPAPSARPSARPAASPCGRIVVDAERRVVTLPAGSGFDPGGIGKGLAADLLADELARTGALGSCIDLGGDVRVAGWPPSGERWVIAVGATRPTQVALRDGAVATSSPSGRSWTRGGAVRHHLVDPRSGRATRAEVLEVSVVAAHAWQADALTKAVLVHGVERGFELLDSLGAAAQAVTIDGVHRSVGWPAFALDADAHGDDHDARS